MGYAALKYTASVTETGVFETEFLPHVDALYNYAYRLTSNMEDAQDLVQDTMLRAYRYVNYYQQGTNAKSWLFRMMQNHFINLYRKNSKAPLMTDYDQLLFTPPSASIEAGEFQLSLSDDVLNGLNSLPAHLKSILLLNDVENFKYEEISKIMDIPLGTVKTWIHKARKQMKAYLESQGYKR